MIERECFKVFRSLATTSASFPPGTSNSFAYLDILLGDFPGFYDCWNLSVTLAVTEAAEVGEGSVLRHIAPTQE